MKFSKLIYILYFLLAEPFSKIYRRKIKVQLESDWNNKTQFHLQFQKRQLKKVLQSALKTHYYKDLNKKNNPQSQLNLKNFPIISKADIQKSPLAFFRKNPFIPHSYQNTGGSTGEPLKFSVSLSNKHLELIHQSFFYQRIGVKNNELIVSIDGVSISKKKIKRNIFWKKRTPNFPFGAYRFSATNLNNQNVALYLEKIKALKPSIIRTYPSALIFLAEYVLNNEKTEGFPFLKGIMVTSEIISKKNIELFSKAFSCPILPQYGMTESCAFAFTYPNSLKYYCSPFYGITEVVNEKNEMVKKGEIGELVLTSLGNFHHPFIRYKTGDFAEYGGTENGFVVLNRILGRTQDYIIDKKFNKHLLVGLIFGSHNKVFNKIIKWQIIQEIPGEIEIRLYVSDSWLKIDEYEIFKVFNSVAKLKIRLNFTNDFLLTPSGKRKFLVQMISNHEKSSHNL